MRKARSGAHRLSCARVIGSLGWALGVLGLNLPTAAAQSAVSPPGGALALAGVTVIDVTDGRLVPDQTVVVVDNRVRIVGPARAVHVPSGAQVVDARGKYLVPGLWDMHVHADSPDDAELYPRYLAHGVTGLREMAQRFEGGADSFHTWQRAIRAGTRVGPRVAGPSADVNSPNSMHALLGVSLEGPGSIVISTPEDARRVVDSLQAAGMAFIKMHDDMISVDVYFALLREARRVGIPVVGHTPTFATDVEVADSGQRSVEHVGSIRCWHPVMIQDNGASQDSLTDAEKEHQCAAAVAAYIRNGTWLVPTVVQPRATLTPETPEQAQQIARDVHTGQRVVELLHRLGARAFLAGTDLRGPRPGFSLLEEVVLLAESGLTPLEALQAATLNPAQFFHATDSLGAVAPGKLADLVLLDANPLVDIHNILQTRAVVANGRYFDRAALEAMDPDGQQLAREYEDYGKQYPSSSATGGAPRGS